MPCRHGSFPQNCRDRAMLAIASFIIHYLDWQDRKRLREGRKKPIGHLIENAAIRSSDLPPNGIPGPWRVAGFPVSQPPTNFSGSGAGRAPLLQQRTLLASLLRYEPAD